MKFYTSTLMLTLLLPTLFIGDAAFAQQAPPVSDRLQPAIQARSTPLAKPGGGDFVDVAFGKTIYHLPVKLYRIGTQAYDKENDHAGFGFSAILPDVAPASSDLAEVATWGMGTGWHRELHVLVEYGREFITQEKTLENAFADSRSMKLLQDKQEKNGEKVVRFKYLDPSKFTVMNNGCKKYTGISGYLGYQPLACQTKRGLLIARCFPTTSLPNGWKVSPHCEVMINFDKKTELSYGYSYAYLDDTVSIYEKLTDLLDSFRGMRPSIAMNK